MKIKDAEYQCDRCGTDMNEQGRVSWFHSTDLLRKLPERDLCQNCQVGLKEAVGQYLASGAYDLDHDPRYVAGRQAALREMGEHAAELLGIEPPPMPDLDHLIELPSASAS